jgi:methylated-DNA-[protein]-cysteine S-methyltransferase
MNASTVIDSPIGPLYLEASPAGLHKLAFGAGKKFPQEAREGSRGWKASATGKTPATASRPVSAAHPEAVEMLERAVMQVREYFDGERKDFDVPLDIEGTPFRKRVWQAIAAIPYGETISYAQLAAAAGSPGAYRAAGAGCGSNPIALVVPCHRVVGSDRSLHGFGGGLPMKRWLLDHEASHLMARAARQAVLV